VRMSERERESYLSLSNALEHEATHVTIRYSIVGLEDGVQQRRTLEEGQEHLEHRSVQPWWILDSQHAHQAREKHLALGSERILVIGHDSHDHTQQANHQAETRAALEALDDQWTNLVLEEEPVSFIDGCISGAPSMQSKAEGAPYPNSVEWWNRAELLVSNDSMRSKPNEGATWISRGSHCGVSPPVIKQRSSMSAMASATQRLPDSPAAKAGVASALASSA